MSNTSPHMTMYEFLTAANWPQDKRVLKYFGKDMTMGEFLGAVDNLAYYLKTTLDVKKGDNVAICLPNMPNAAIAFYAVNKCGAAANVIYPLIGEMGLFNILDKMKPKAIFLADIFFDKYKSHIAKLGLQTIICPIGQYASFIMKLGIKIKAIKEMIPKPDFSDKVIHFRDCIEKQGDVPITTDGADVATYLHSGGTTGEPKTIVTSNCAVNQMAQTLDFTFGGNYEKEVALMILPLFHTFGLCVNMHTFLRLGARIILIPKFNPKSAAITIKKEKVSIICGVPKMYEKLLNESTFRSADCKHFRFLFCGGDTLPSPLRQAFDSHIKSKGSKVPIMEGYGLTETASVVSVNTINDYRAGSIGKPISGVKVKIVDENLIEMPRGEQGDILINSPSLMQSYYEDDETTKTAIVEIDGERWLRSGDCGYMDEDGFVFFLDRKKRVIIIAGINVYPAEIERLVNDLPDVKMCCAVEGKAKKDFPIIELIVVPNDGVKPTPALNKAILDVCRKSLTRHALPGRIIFKDDLPVTPIGKVDFKRVAEERNS